MIDAEQRYHRGSFAEPTADLRRQRAQVCATDPLTRFGRHQSGGTDLFGGLGQGARRGQHRGSAEPLKLAFGRA